MKDVSRAFAGWMRGSGPEGDIVLGSASDLPRNLRGIPFPATANREQLKQMSFKSLNPRYACPQQLGPVRGLKMAEVERRMSGSSWWREHLVSPEHTKNTHAKGSDFGQAG